MPIYERHSSLADILNFYHPPDLSHLLMSFPQQSLQSSPRRSSQADVRRSPSSVALSDPSRNTGGIDCATVAIIVRWWCVFLKTSLEFVRWSNAALNDKISSYLQKTPWRFSLPPVFVRGVLLWGECVEALPPPQTELGPGDQHDEESEKWSEICHYRSFVHVALSQRFSHITVEIWDQFTADGIKLSFSRLFLSFFQCEFLQLAIDLRF